MARKGHITPLNQGGFGSESLVGCVLMGRSVIFLRASSASLQVNVEISWATPDQCMDLACPGQKSYINAVHLPFQFDQWRLIVICPQRYETLIHTVIICFLMSIASCGTHQEPSSSLMCHNCVINSRSSLSFSNYVLLTGPTTTGTSFQLRSRIEQGWGCQVTASEQ